MSLWHCPRCRVLQGPCPGNVCPTCGQSMQWATVGEATSHPARLTDSEVGKAIGSALDSSLSRLTEIRQREQQAIASLKEQITIIETGVLYQACILLPDLRELLDLVDSLQARLQQRDQEHDRLRAVAAVALGQMVRAVAMSNAFTDAADALDAALTNSSPPSPPR